MAKRKKRMTKKKRNTFFKATGASKTIKRYVPKKSYDRFPGVLE